MLPFQVTIPGYTVPKQEEGNDPRMNSAEIYLITNTATKLQYVGQTKCMKKKKDKYVYCGYEDRFKEHIRNAFSTREETQKSCPKLYEAMRAYPRDQVSTIFRVELVETCSRDDINKMEKFYIRKFGSRKNGYNVTAGGQSARRRRRKIA